MSSFPFQGRRTPVQCPDAAQDPPSAQGPFAHHRALPVSGWHLAPPRRAFPLLHRSYGPMRQTNPLPPPPSLPGSAGLCRLLSAPAGGWPFPTLSLRVFPWMQGPVPRRLAGCLYPFLPLRHRPSLRLNQVGAHQIRSAISKRVSFRGGSHSLRFQPPGLLATPIAPTAPARRAGGQPWRFRPSRTRVVTDHVHRIS